MSLTGCRVLHFTWNGDSNQEQVTVACTGGDGAPFVIQLFASMQLALSYPIPPYPPFAIDFPDQPPLPDRNICDLVMSVSIASP